MPLASGDRLGPYEIIALIGRGGMGEVYRAHDSRLGRDVAIKVSAAKFSQRSEREARAIAALNHPHICSLYDVGPDFLVMEYVAGAPLPNGSLDSNPINTEFLVRPKHFFRSMCFGVLSSQRLRCRGENNNDTNANSSGTC
jgi:serine/threonine protein kinase